MSQGVHDQVVAERDHLAITRQKLESRVERLEATNQSLTSERLALIDESEDLRVSKGQLQGSVARLTRRGDELAESLEASESMLASRTFEIGKMRSVYEGLVSDLEGEVSAGQIQIERLRSGLRMNLSQEILFPSGSAKLNKQGTAVLRKVGERLIGIPNAIEVLGHTDDRPISGRYPSNWELAAARASSVVRLFVDLGVDPSKLRAVSRGEYDPLAANDTAEGRAKNRRIEIRLASASASATGTPEPARENPEVASENAEPASEEAEPVSEAAESASVEAEPVEDDAEPAGETPAQSDADPVSVP